MHSGKSNANANTINNNINIIKINNKENKKHLNNSGNFIFVFIHQRWAIRIKELS